MIKKINYYSEEEKNIILEENKDMYLIEHAKLYNEKYLIFSDSHPIEVLQKEQGEKISILEAENENLKEGLRAVLRGDMQSLAYILYPEDFNTFQKAGV